MSHAGTQTNGASLEDCHANFFSLTDVCGIRWVVYRESDCPSGTAKVQNGHDAVLSSFANCLEADLLAVWRRVPRSSLTSTNFDSFGNPTKVGLSAAETQSFEEKNPVTQRKELWIFWYGDKPEDLFKRLVSSDLKEVPDSSGTWENVLPYEARTLLYKALNNLIERNLLSKDFVRLGKWFVQPFEGPEKTLQKASHLSFSFQYFVHGESFVCASVDVRQHPAVRRLGPQHLSLARGAVNPVQVILAPFGLSATLTGVTYKSADVGKLLQEWHRFYPLDRNRYSCQDSNGDHVTMAPAVEVLVAGVKMVYPTCYVLVTDLDSYSQQDGGKKTRIPKSGGFDMKQSLMENHEPSPFTSSNHPLLSESFNLQCLTEYAWQDGLGINPESSLSVSEQQQTQYHQQNLNSSDLNQSNSGQQNQAQNLMAADLVHAWDFAYPGRYVKKKPRSKIREKSSKDHRIRFNSKVPFHKKSESVDELTWALDNTDLINSNQGITNQASNKSGPNSSAPTPSGTSTGKKNQGPSLVSPAPGSVGGPVTPVFTPKGSVRTPGGAELLSPAPAPPSNGPLTPMDLDHKPNTPKSVPNFAPSPFENKKPVIQPSNLVTKKLENTEEKAIKRPALPTKEYEEDLETESLNMSETIFDTSSIRLWLNHPVKRFKPMDSKYSLDPLKPAYRRQSQVDLILDSNETNPVLLEELKNDAVTAPVIKQERENLKFNNFNNGPVSNQSANDPFDLIGDNEKNGTSKQNPPDNGSLFTSEGLQPSIDDLENIFDDSSDETEGQNGAGLSPPGSNKPANSGEDSEMTKLKNQAKLDSSNLPHDQLAKMFPTPPSLEHPSPAECTMEVDHAQVKMEPFSPAPDLTDWWTGGEDFDYTLSSSKFAPLKRLYSDTLPALNQPQEYKYKPLRRPKTEQRPNQPNVGGAKIRQTPLGTPNMKPSPGPPSVEAGGPRSIHHVNSPAAASKNDLKNSEKVPEASSLMLNLVLSDTIFNVFRDHNFDSCTICVCSNEGNIRGRDAAPYLPNFLGDDEINCICGFSAMQNRKLAHQSGLFYEDETEITGITEDLYHRKKTSLLLLDPKYDSNEEQNQERLNIVDSIPPQLLELITEIGRNQQNNSLLKTAKSYLKNANNPNPSISMVDLMDTNFVAFNTLEKVKILTETGKLDEAQKGTCVHRWTLIQASGPFCSEDIVRVMKSIQPLLNECLHLKNKMATSQQKVKGPLTWRQFHQMAGSTTKGNTDDQCEPLPVPAITVGHEQDFLSLAPQALHYWEAMNLEPYAQPRDIAYIVVTPESDFVVSRVKTFFKNLSCVYESCRLGRHVPISKVLKDNGILRVGKKYAEKLANDPADPWFEMLGESSTALLLKLYSQVCRHYLTPILLQLPLDRSLIENSMKQVLVEKTPASPMPPPSMSNTSDFLMNSSGNFGSTDSYKLGKEDSDLMGKENINSSSDPNNGSDSDREPPAIVIYLVDPFGFGPASDNCDFQRMTTLGLMRCFSQMLPNISETLKANISLQLVPLDSILETCQSSNHARMPPVMRGMAFSVFAQARRPLQYQRECKTLTGFGPASSAEKYLKSNENIAKFVRKLHSPAFVLAPSNLKKKIGSDSEAFGSSNERSSVLFVNYCLSEDQHWLLASCCDDRGELLKTVTINIDIPNKTRRKKASARRVGLRKLMDWILSVMAMSLVPWRLVIGRIGRIGHGELRGWSVLLSRKTLKRASKELRDLCAWKSEVPCILSACLVSMEPDSHLRLMADQYTPDERFGQTASNCQLSTPKDVTCTHVLVFPTSAKAQSSQKEFNDHRDETAEDVGDIFGLPGFDIDTNNDGIDVDIDNINDLFNDDNWGDAGGQPGSPRSPSGMRNDISQPNSPKQQDQFRYGQEEPDEQIEILQQPLALGYMVSTAKTGPMPRWFWASCPHLESTSPVFLKSALHINVASLIHGSDDGFAPNSSSGRVHSLDSTYTADVLRYVLEGYNALSWLSLDFEKHDRRSCLPIHVQELLQMYNSLAALV